MHLANTEIRLDGKTLTLAFTPRQLERIRTAMAAADVADLSAWIRELVTAAVGSTDRLALEVHVGMCDLPLDVWVRELAVSAASASPFRSHLKRVHTWQRARRKEKRGYAKR